MGDGGAGGVGSQEGIRVGGGRPTTGCRGRRRDCVAQSLIKGSTRLARPAAPADFPMAFIERRYPHTRLGGGVDTWKTTCGT